MFGFGRKKENPDRKAAREDFERIIMALKSSSDLVQMTVGHSINLASSAFHQRYSSISDFQRLPKSEAISYIEKLADTESKLKNEKVDYHAAFGFQLFRMWLVAVAQHDTELMHKFSNELVYFSKKGESFDPVRKKPTVLELDLVVLRAAPLVKAQEYDTSRLASQSDITKWLDFAFSELKLKPDSQQMNVAVTSIFCLLKEDNFLKELMQFQASHPGEPLPQQFRKRMTDVVLKQIDEYKSQR